jgi:hypothetical protein
MISELINKLFHPVDNYQDGASVLYGHRESIRYKDGENRFIEFDIEYDGKMFVVIGESPYWMGELSGRIDSKDRNKIRDRIGQYFKKRGMEVEMR